MILVTNQYEAIPESLKNMLLVMSTSGAFEKPGQSKAKLKSGTDVGSAQQARSSGPVPDEENELWQMTWKTIGRFLPGLKDGSVSFHNNTVYIRQMFRTNRVAFDRIIPSCSAI